MTTGPSGEAGEESISSIPVPVRYFWRERPFPACRKSGTAGNRVAQCVEERPGTTILPSGELEAFLVRKGRNLRIAGIAERGVERREDGRFFLLDMGFEVGPERRYLFEKGR